MIPYDSHGNLSTDQSWVPISKDTYIAESGAKMRDLAGFCVGCLCFALMCSLAEEAVTRVVRLERPCSAIPGRRLDPDVRGYAPEPFLPATHEDQEQTSHGTDLGDW